MAEGGFGGESLYLQCPRLDEERANAYPNYANLAQQNYQRQIQAHNDMMDEYRRDIEYNRALERMNGEITDEDGPDYLQAMSVPSHFGRSDDELSFYSRSGRTTRSNSADDVRDLISEPTTPTLPSENWEEVTNQGHFDNLQLEDGDDFYENQFDPDYLHEPTYPAVDQYEPHRVPHSHSVAKAMPQHGLVTPTRTHNHLPSGVYDEHLSGEDYDPAYHSSDDEKHVGERWGEDDILTPKDQNKQLPPMSEPEPLSAFPTRMDDRHSSAADTGAYHPSDAHQGAESDSQAWPQPQMSHQWPRRGHRLDGLDTVTEEADVNAPVTPPRPQLTPDGHLRNAGIPLPLSDTLRDQYAPIANAGPTLPGEGRFPMHEHLRRNDLADYAQNLEKDHHLEDEERQRRWDDRLRFQEMEDRDRRRAWHHMDGARRRELGLQGDDQRRLYAHQMLPSYGPGGFGGGGGGLPIPGSFSSGLPMGSGGHPISASLPSTIVPGMMHSMPSNLGVAPNVPAVPLGHGFNPIIPPLAPAPIGFGVSPNVNSLDLHPSGNNGRDRFSQEFLDDFRGLNAKLRESLSEKISALTDLNAHRVAIPNIPRRT